LKVVISLSGVASFTTGQEGGPSYGGLRNNKGFVAYVAARSREQKLGPDEMLQGPVLRKTGDAQIDADIKALTAHNKMLQKRNRWLQQMFRTQGAYDLIASMERGELLLVANESNLRISDDARSAIDALLDPNALETVGLKLEPTGQIANPRTLRILLGKRQVEALRRLVSEQHQTDSASQG
jgi:hypothetical protein